MKLALGFAKAENTWMESQVRNARGRLPRRYDHDAGCA